MASNIAVAKGAGNATWQLPVTYATAAPGLYFVGALDVNGDRRIDLVVADNGGLGNTGYFSVLLGNGDATFQPGKASQERRLAPVHVATTVVSPCSFASSGKRELRSAPLPWQSLHKARALVHR